MGFSENFNESGILDILKIVSRTKDLYEMREALLTSIIRNTGYDCVFLAFFPEGIKEYIVVSAVSNGSSVFEKKLGYDDIPKKILRIMSRLAPERTNLKKSDFSEQGIFNRFMSNCECGCSDVFPIVFKKHAEGFIMCCKGEDDDESDFRMLSSLSGLMEIFIENKRRTIKVESLIIRLKDSVKRISSSIRQLYEQNAVEQFLATACRLLCEITRSKSGLIVVNEVQRGLQSAVRYGIEMDLLKTFEEIKSSRYYDPAIDCQYFNYPFISEITSNTLIGSFIYHRLVKNNKTIGYILAANSEEYLDEEISVLGIFAHQILVGMDISVTSKEILKHQVIEKELEIVAEQQKLIMSGNNIDLQGFGEISFLHKPSQHIGGDFCKIFRVDDRRVGVFLTDVMGHGVLSNYFGAIIKGSLKTLISQGKSASGMLTAINSVLYEDFDRINIFATARVAIFDADKNSIISANAGHMYPIAIKRENGKIQMEDLDFEQGIPLGVLCDTDYDEYEYRLDEYEMVVFYTDGIIEAEGKLGDEYGVERLKRFLMDNCSMDSNSICLKFEKELHEFTGRDNLTDDYVLLVYKRFK